MNALMVIAAICGVLRVRIRHRLDRMQLVERALAGALVVMRRSRRGAHVERAGLDDLAN